MGKILEIEIPMFIPDILTQSWGIVYKVCQVILSLTQIWQLLLWHMLLAMATVLPGALSKCPLKYNGGWQRDCRSHINKTSVFKYTLLIPLHPA